MKTSKQIIILTLTIFNVSCSSRIDNKNFEHNYSKYWNKYTDKQFIDTLFSDTLNIGTDDEGNWTTREYYIRLIKQLIADLEDDKKEIDSFYPMKPFDELTMKKLPFGFKKTFTNEQTKQFLELINDPVSFDWAETTFEPEFQVEFLKDYEVVSSLSISKDKSVIKPNPDFPEFKKFKFGNLKLEQKNILLKLIKLIEK